MIPKAKSFETEQLLDHPRQSGFVLQWTDMKAAREGLKQMAAESDPVECQQTLEYLMKALNETRAEGASGSCSYEHQPA